MSEKTDPGLRVVEKPPPFKRDEIIETLSSPTPYVEAFAKQAEKVFGPPKPAFAGITAETLDNWFTYHPPTDETKPKYAVIADAYQAALDAFHDQPTFESVTTAARKFVEAIIAVCPPSADATAAIRCVRLARNAKNDHLCQRGGKEYDPRLDFGQIAREQLLFARYQANAAIACGGR
jgi:hypothetical protein